MSAFGGKADINRWPPKCPLIAKSGHKDGDAFPSSLHPAHIFKTLFFSGGLLFNPMGFMVVFCNHVALGMLLAPFSWGPFLRGGLFFEGWF